MPTVGTLALMTIPIAENVIVADVPVGVLLVSAFMGLIPLMVLLGGWASNNKFSLLGAFRSAAMLISVEIPLGITILSIVLIVGDFSLKSIVAFQEQFLWFIFILPLGFFVFLPVMFTESERLPFDMPEAESELVMGWRTEFSGWRKAIFMMMEYLTIEIFSVLAALLFLGGWDLGPVDDFIYTNIYASFLTGTWLDVFIALTQIVILFAKTYVFILFYVVARNSFPRPRIDQFTAFGWKVLIPMSVINLAWAMVFVYMFFA